MRYTDIIFDLYGTLVDIHTEETERVWEKTALYFGFYGAHYTPEELKAAFREELKRREASAGQTYECFPDIPAEQVMATLFQAAGVTQNADQLGFHAAQLFRISSMEYIRLYPYIPEALAALRNKGCRLWLLSNAQRVFTAYELRLLGLEASFDGIFISSDYGCRKPDSRFFRALLDGRQLDRHKCLMIGNDRHTDIAGAQAVGLDTVYLHTGLTPEGQDAADPGMLPGHAAPNCHHYEFEGDDWRTLSGLLLRLIGD